MVVVVIVGRASFGNRSSTGLFDRAVASSQSSQQSSDARRPKQGRDDECGAFVPVR